MKPRRRSPFLSTLRWNLILTLPLAAILVVGIQPAPADDIAWDGDGDANNSGDWSVDFNWDIDFSPIGGDKAILGDVGSGDRTVSYDGAASGVLDALQFDQSTAGSVNELLVMKNLAVTNAITLGAAAGVERITVGSDSATGYNLTPTGGLTINSGGEVVLTATGNGTTTAPKYGNLGGSGTTVISGGTLTVAPTTDSTASSAQNTNNGGLSMDSGALVIDNTSGVQDRRLQVNGTLDITGGLISSTKSVAVGVFGLSGATNTLKPDSFDTDLSVQLTRNGDQTLDTSVLFGPFTVRGYGVKTLTSTLVGGNIGVITVIDGSGTPGNSPALKLGSDLTLTSNANQPNFATFSQAPESGRIDGGIDTNGFTLDLSGGSGGGVWTPNKGQASVTSSVWGLSDSAGTGAIKATAFDFTSAGVTVNVAAGTTLEAVGGNGTASDLGDLDGDAGTIAATSTFRYSGAATAGTPATLTSNRTIGNLEVASGALLFGGSGETAGATSLTAGGTLILDYGTADTSKLADGEVLTLDAGTIGLSGGTHEEVVASTTLDGASSIIQTGGSAVLNMGAITNNPGSSLAISVSGSAKTTNANDATGILGVDWLQVAGGLATNNAGTIEAYSSYATVDRLAGVILDDPSSNVGIVNGGSSGSIALGAATATVNTLTMLADAGSATVDFALSDLLNVSTGRIFMLPTAGALSLGSTPDDGFLTAGGPLDTAGTLIITQGSANLLTINSVIEDNGTGVVGLTHTGTGTTVLAGSNTYTGRTIVNGGKLSPVSESSLGSGPDSFTADHLTLDGGTLLATTSFTISDANRGLTLGASGGTVEVAGTATTNLTIDTVITGAGALTKTGAGILTLTASNDYSGGTTLQGNGILHVTDPDALGGGPLTLQSTQASYPATVQLSGGITLTKDIHIDITTGREAFGNLSGNNTLDSDITVTGATGNIIGFINDAAEGSTFTVGGTINAPDYTGQLWVRGTGAAGSRLGTFSSVVNAPNALFGTNGGADWTIASTGNDWNYTVISGGTGSLVLGVDDALDTGARVNWSSSTTGNLDLNGHNQTVAGLDYTGVVATFGVTNKGGADSTLTLSGLGLDRVFAGAISDGASNKVSLVMDSAGRTQTLSGNNTYTGDTTISAGTLILGIDDLDDGSTVRINGAASILQLPDGTTDDVQSLVIDGTPMAAGTYGSTSSTATNQDDDHFSGTGVLNVLTSGSGYSSWADANGAAGQALDQDHDSDGVSNGVEYLIGGPNGDTTGFTALPGVTNTGGTLSVTWDKSADYAGVYGTDFVVETSTTLEAGSWTDESAGVTVLIGTSTVTYTFPDGPVKTFARLKVTGP